MKLILTLVALATFSTHAGWHLMKKDTGKAEGSGAVLKLLQSPRFENSTMVRGLRSDAMNSILVGKQVPPLVGMELTIERYEWYGPTNCEAGDPRLEITNESGCTQYSYNQGMCFTGLMPSDVDPCEI